MAGPDSAIYYYERAFAEDPDASVAAIKLARAYAMKLDRGGEIPGYAGTAGARRVNELLDRAFASDSSSEVWTIRGMLARAIDPAKGRAGFPSPSASILDARRNEYRHASSSGDIRGRTPTSAALLSRADQRHCSTVVMELQDVAIGCVQQREHRPGRMTRCLTLARARMKLADREMRFRTRNSSGCSQRGLAIGSAAGRTAPAMDEHGNKSWR
jgi:hypothetical protein